MTYTYYKQLGRSRFASTSGNVWKIMLYFQSKSLVLVVVKLVHTSSLLPSKGPGIVSVHNVQSAGFVKSGRGSMSHVTTILTNRHPTRELILNWLQDILVTRKLSCMYIKVGLQSISKNTLTHTCFSDGLTEL